VESFYEDQQVALKQFFQGKNIFFSAHTGYGKSLVFQAIPVIADFLDDNLLGTSVVLVILPLISLMKDQVKNCNEHLGISAVAIYSKQDEEILQNIEDGVYSLVYTSPEALLANNRWRALTTSRSFRESCVAIAIDEGHCLVHW
jgi:superfamily II DNA helicase RecQ